MSWLYRRGGKWWIGWRIGARQFLKSTGETDKAEAKKQLSVVERLEIAQKAEALTEAYYQAATGRTIKRARVREFCNAWLTNSESATTHGTMLKYRQVVREFCDHVRADETGLMMDDVTVDHVAGFLTEKRKQLAPGTVQGYKRILGSIFLLAQNEGKITGNPVALARHRGKTGDNGTTKKRPFTLAELAILHKKATAFWRYMIVAGFYTGQSLGDLVTMRAETVNLATGLITMNRRKTGKQVIIPIAGKLRAVLVSIWPKDGKNYFWPEQAARYLKVGPSPFSQEFYELMAGAGMVQSRAIVRDGSGPGRDTKREPTKLGFHNLRHTFVTHLKIAGAVDSVARELAGHSSTAVNTAYTHLPAETLKKAVNGLPALK